MTTINSSNEIKKINNTSEHHEDFRMFGLITFLIADGMTFAGFFAAYLTYKAVNPLPDGSIYINFSQSGQGTSNLGKYTMSKCSGNRTDKKGKLLELIDYCEVELDDGNRFWTKVSRLSGDSDVGVSKFIFLGGTNSFNKLKGKSCNYAVSYFKNKIFGNSKCIISNELFKDLKK